MRDSETSLIVKSDTALLLFLDTVCAGVENDLAKVLEGAYPIFTDYSDHINALHNNIESMKQREISFYNKVINKLAEFAGEKTNEKIVLFFDIDETLIHCKGDQFDDRTRPILPKLFERIREQFPNIQFGICSGKGQEEIDRFMNAHEGLGFVYGVSSREASTLPKDKSRGDALNDRQRQKINTYSELRSTFGSYCFLVDDGNESIWEQKKMGICIKGGEFYGFPEV